MGRAFITLTALAFVVFATGAGVAAQAVPRENVPSVEVRVWQDVNDAHSIFISARPSGGSWATLGTIPLPLDDGHSRSGRFRYGDISVTVPMPGAEATSVEVRVWQDVNDARSIFISARPSGGSWATLGTIPLPLDDGHSRSGRFRYGDITLEVPLPDEPPASTPTPSSTTYDVEYELPRIEFSGDFSPAAQAAHRAEVEDVVAYFAGRFGIWVSDLTISFEEDSQHGSGLSACGRYHAKTIDLLGEDCFKVLAHEYAHAIQDKLGTLEPTWLVEGVANRWEAQYNAHTGAVTYADHLANSVLPLSQTIQEPLLTYWNQGQFGIYTPESYFLAHLGTEYLVERAGEQSLYDFFAQLESHSSWHDAFSQAFGLSIYEFSDGFEEYREQVAPMFRRIEGRVIGSDSKPIAGVLFDVYAIAPGGLSYIWVIQNVSNFDGTFSVVTPGGSVALEVGCPNSGGGWYTHDGGLSQDLTPLVVGREASPDIVIRLPVSQAEAESVPCNSSTLALYTILGSDGEPVEGLEMSISQGSPRNTFQNRTTTQDGEVEFPVGNPSGVWITIDPETKCPAPSGYENSVLLGRVDFGGGFSPSQYWIPPNTTFVGVEAENVGDRTIMIDFAEDCP